MTNAANDDPLRRYTEGIPARPLPATLRAAREDVLAAVAQLRAIPDASLTSPWRWKGDSEEEIRYGFYRINELFELAGIEAAAAIRRSGLERGRTADILAPATAARWDLEGLLIPLADATWDADPGGGEWTVRQTLGHVISAQRSYGAGAAWWQTQSHRPDDPDLPATAPESIYEALPTEEAESEGRPADVRGRLGTVLDLITERLAAMPDERLALGARWAGFAVDVGFRLGRSSSHIREHTIQVEKTLAMLELRPSENDRLVRLVLGSWGRAEAVVFGATGPDEAIERLRAAATAARVTAAELAALAS